MEHCRIYGVRSIVGPFTTALKSLLLSSSPQYSNATAAASRSSLYSFYIVCHAQHLARAPPRARAMSCTRRVLRLAHPPRLSRAESCGSRTRHVSHTQRLAQASPRAPAAPLPAPLPVPPPRDPSPPPSPHPSLRRVSHGCHCRTSHGPLRPCCVSLEHSLELEQH